MQRPMSPRTAFSMPGLTVFGDCGGSSTILRASSETGPPEYGSFPVPSS